MVPMSEQPTTALRDNLLSLAGQCPVDLSNPVDCPLFAVRKLGRSTSRRWLQELTEDDWVYLNAYHCVCFRITMETRLAGQCS